MVCNNCHTCIHKKRQLRVETINWEEFLLDIQLTRSTVDIKIAELCSEGKFRSCAAFQGKNSYISGDLTKIARGTPLAYSPMHSLCPCCAKPCTKYPPRKGPEICKEIYEFVKKRGLAPHKAGQYCLEFQETNANQSSIHLPTIKRGVKKTRVSL